MSLKFLTKPIEKQGCLRKPLTALTAIIAGLFFLLVLAPTVARAQATGRIAGQVNDPAANVVVGVQLELINNDTALSTHAVTGANGSYVFPLVMPGTYSLHADASGFQPKIIQNFEVKVNATTRLDVTLKIGSRSDEIQVTGASPLVETSNAMMGDVVEHQEIIDLPLNGRNFTQLGTLLPGVVAPPAGLGGADGNATVGGFGDSTGGFSVNGMRNQSNNFLLDGAPNNDSFNSGFVMRPPPDAIEEFKIMTHSYEAQYGRNAGSVVNVVTRSGTNQVHGSLWEFNRESTFAAKNYFSTIKPIYLQNQTGASAGGPIHKNKAFIFGYYEALRLKDATSNSVNVPVFSDAERRGNFSELFVTTSAAAGGAGQICTSTTEKNCTGRIIDPLTGSQFNYGGTPNAVDPARVSSISSLFLKNLIPHSNAVNNYYYAQPATIDNRDMYGFRGDWKPNENHTIMGRYLYGHQSQYNPTGSTNFAPTGNHQNMKLQDAMGSDTWTMSTSRINVARYAWQRIDGRPGQTSGINLSTYGFGYPSANSIAAGLPYISVSGYFSTGDSQQPFAQRNNQVNTLSDDLTWLHGRHNLQFGGEVRRDRIGLVYINRPNGAFTFSGSSFTTNSLADFLLGYPYVFRQATGSPLLAGSSWTYSAYAQDQFRVNKHLTIDVGLRYEVNRPYVEDKNHIGAFHPGQQSTIYSAAPTGLVYPGDLGTPRSLYYADTNNFGPRIGVAYDPKGNGKNSIRGAWGVFYDAVPGQGDLFQSGTLAAPFQPLQEVDFYSQSSTPTSTNFSNPYNNTTQAVNGFAPGLTFIGWLAGHSFKTPTVQQYNFGVQHQTGEYMSTEISYVGTRTWYLPMFIDANPTNYKATSNTQAGQNAYVATTRAAYPSFGLVRPTFSVGRSWYDGLQAGWKLHNYRHITATAAYTWSHSLDHSSGLNISTDSKPVTAAVIGDYNEIDNLLKKEKGSSIYDARHRFVTSVQYTMPRLQSQPLFERLTLGGWNANAIFQVQSGNPMTVINGSNSAQTLNFRPNYTCNPNSKAPHKFGTSGTYFNAGCLALPTTSTGLIDNRFSGNLPRSLILGPGFFKLDGSLFKSFSVYREQKIDFRFEVFNVTNTPHFAQPGLYMDSSLGKITSTVGNDQRVIQLGAKYAF
jgi:outer membrane receptor protein involved in Fe transport